MGYRIILMIILAVLLVAGCQTSPPPKPQDQPAQRVLESMTPRQYVAKGIEYLSVGDEENARLYLNEAITVEPDGRAAATARLLLEQMNIDPKEYLGRKSFSYRVRPGESLALLAKRFLGSQLKFYSLARYNNIANPSYLETGQIIAIPGKRPPEPVRQSPAPAIESEPSEPFVSEMDESPPELQFEPEPETEPTSEPTTAAQGRESSIGDATTEIAIADDPYRQARQMYNEGNYAGVVALLEDVPDPGPAAVDLLVDSYQAQAKELQAAGQMREAKNRLERAFTLKPTDGAIQQRLDELNQILHGRQADHLYQQGLSARRSENLEQAYEAFSQALALDPTHEKSRRQADEVESLLVENYHRQALSLYKSQQELCKAIALWDKVLQLQPGHTSALTNRETAQRVAEKLGTPCS